MLSYQHAYHAGSRPDMHKHKILCRVLDVLVRRKAPLTYVETHSGRGIYDLEAPEARKTGEAAEGWLKVFQDVKTLAALPKSYLGAIRALNKGKLAPLYPGSPYFAAHILRPQDKMRLMELHPAEYAALKKNMGNDKRAQIIRQDGLEGAMEIKTAPDLILVDPSYEIKSEYESIPDFAAALHRKWPAAAILTWTPMLPAKRHEIALKKIRKLSPRAEIMEESWAKPEDQRGMYGSIMVGINVPHGC